jgi:hypothetical protein
MDGIGPFGDVAPLKGQLATSYRSPSSWPNGSISGNAGMSGADVRHPPNLRPEAPVDKSA